MGENINGLDWLYPNLISKDGILFAFRQHLITHAKTILEELGNMYLYHVLPLPQRKYRNNRRGREMTKKQLLFDKKLKRKSQIDEDYDRSMGKKVKTM